MTDFAARRLSIDDRDRINPERAPEHAYQAYVELRPGQPAELHLLIENLHCLSCIRRIERAYEGVSDLVDARVNLTNRRLRLRWRGGAEKAQELANRVRELGFTVTPFHSGELATARDNEGRHLLRCLAVAGFAAANVMLLSVAVWAGLASDMGPATRTLLQWLSALIALPAIAYAGRPFFSSALGAIRSRSLNMDVPISIAVLLTAAMSVFEASHGAQHTYFDACVSLLFILLIGRYLDHLARARARGAVERMSALSAMIAQVIGDDGRLFPVPARDLPVGAEIMVSAGGRVPADGIVVRGDTDIDTSLITGETMPRHVSAGDRVYAGTVNLSASVRVRVDANASETILADIVRLMDAAEQKRSRYVRLADRAARLYAPVVHLAALLTFLAWIVFGGISWQAALLIAVAVLLITCPCALGLAVPAVQTVACGRLMERGVLVTQGDALERLAVADTIVFDKTGTLTFGRVALSNASEIDPKDGRLAASIAVASQHPLCKGLVQAFGPVIARTDVSEAAGCGLTTQIDGAEVRLGSRAWCGISGDEQADGELGPELWLTVPGRNPVRFAFEDVERPDVSDVAEQLMSLGFDIELLSGDRPSVVRHVAQKAGVETWQATCTPSDKLARLTELKKSGRRVLMVGDGLNDAPALSGAFVSMSPASAADISRISADIIIQGDKLMPIVDAIRVARRSRILIFQNFSIAGVYNAIAIPFAVAGFVTPLIAAFAMSASSIVVTLNALRLRWSRLGRSR